MDENWEYPHFRPGKLHIFDGPYVVPQLISITGKGQGPLASGHQREGRPFEEMLRRITDRENEERGLVSNMWCMVLSQNGDNDYLIRK